MDRDKEHNKLMEKEKRIKDRIEEFMVAYGMEKLTQKQLWRLINKYSENQLQQEELCNH